MTLPRIGIDARHAARGLGISTFTTELTRAFRDRGHVQPVWFGSPGVVPEGVESAPIAGPYPVFDLHGAKKAVRDHRLDLVFFPGNTGPIRPIGAPTVVVVHDLLFLRHVSPRQARAFVGHAYERWITPLAMKRASAVTTGSDAAIEDLRRYQPQTPVESIPHGITTRAADGTPIVRDAIVAFSGRDRRKRLDLLLDAYERLATPRPPLVLFANAGVPADLEPTLARIVAENPVTVLRDRAPREDVDATLGAALALVFCTDDEGFGLPVIEGMAAGAPLITGLAPSTREVAADAAALIDAADPARSIHDHLRRLIDDPSARDDLRRRGHARAALYSWDSSAARYESIFLRLTGRG